VEFNLATVSLILAGIASLAVLSMGLRSRILWRIGFRNVLRRKVQVAIAVAGLTVATSIVSGALVIDDSFDATVTAIVLRGTDLVDEVVYLEDERGLRSFFDYQVYADLKVKLGQMEAVDGLAPRIHVPASVRNDRTALVQPSVNLIAFDPSEDLGSFYLSDGTAVSGEELEEGQVYINAALAEEVEAEAGDDLRLFVNGRELSVRVLEVVQDRGRGGWETTENVFIPLAALQEDLGLEGMINLILVSNVGGVDDGYLATDEAVADLNAALGPGHPFTIEALKRDRIQLYTKLLDQLTQLFTLMSAFTVIAGVLLIMNIFSMLAEERKTEMGMVRALGMRRRHLVQAFVLEGFVYAVTSSVLGALAGLGVATVIMEAFRSIFYFFSRDLVIAYEPESLMTAFSLGLLLTLVTVSLASWRISKLNVVRAMRDLPEPQVERAPRREVLVAGLLTVGGLASLYYSVREFSEMAYLLGPALVAFGLALGAMRRLGFRLPMTMAGLFTIAWVLLPYRLVEEVEANINLFIVAGVLLVAGGVLAIVANSKSILRLVTRATRNPRRLPVVRAAVAYPMAKRFRTGITLAMFALIMFTITVMSMVMALTGSTVDVFERRESGGYDIIAFSNPFARVEGMDRRLSEAGLEGLIEYYEALPTARALVRGEGHGPAPHSLIGVTEDFARRNGFTFYRMAPGYDSPRDIWEALLAEEGLAVVDRTAQRLDFGPNFDFRVDVGDGLTIINALGEEVDLTIIGILDSTFVRGVFVSADLLGTFAGTSTPSLFYFRTAADEDTAGVAKLLEREFVDLGLETFVIREEVESSLEVTLNVMQLIQAFVALGLAVGISGLGVLAVRNVVERRPIIGALRALGFRRDMVLKALLIELSFVAVLGILLGLVLGIALSYSLFTRMSIFQDAEFLVPWVDLLLILVLSLVASLLATLQPSRKASRMPPAEALRQVL
jgi:putative ABC transport system permease protein